MRIGHALAALALLTCCGAAHAAPPRVSSPPNELRAGDTWSAVVHASSPTALVIASGRSRLSFRLSRSGSAYRARVTFPRAGRWRYGVLARGRTTFVGTVNVLPPRLRLGEPFDIVEEAAGSYLIADRTGNAVYRLRGKELRVLARIPHPRDLEPTPDGHVLVASDRNVLSLDPATARTETVATADNDVLGVARLSSGAIVVSDLGSRLVTFDGGRTDVLAAGLDGVHGLLATADGIVVCESSTGRILLAKPGGSMDVLAAGLDTPSFAAPTGDGALYVSEFRGGRVSRVAPAGTVTVVARIPSPAAISVAANGELLVASLTGRVARIAPGTGKVSWLY